MTQQAQVAAQHDGAVASLVGIVSAVWSDVLRTDAPGPDANFFALGGTSLQGARVIGRLREEFGIRIPLSMLFENQTVIELATGIAALRAVATAGGGGTIEPIERRPDGSVDAPATFGQRRLWVEEHLQGPSARYNVPTAVEIDGPLDVAALRAALQALVDRHEVFRTTMGVIDGVPRQVVAGKLEVPLGIVDLEVVPEEMREKALLDHLYASAQRPFDIERGPLLRVDLLRMSEQWNVLLINMHHLIIDIRSFELAMAELLELYASATHGPVRAEPPPAVQYADFAAWQQRTIDEATFDRQIDYWKESLRAPLPVLELPIDMPPSDSSAARAASVDIALPRALSRRVREISRQNGATPVMTVLTIIDVLLHRYSGQTDIVVGIPSGTRDLPELEHMLGYFLNTLAVRCDLSGDPTFVELLGRVRDQALGAYANQDVPFERVVNAVQADRSHGPFRVMLLSREDIPAPELSGLTITSVDLDVGTVMFDLLFSLNETGSDLRLALQYNTHLFVEERAHAILEHLRTLLTSAVAMPHARISELNLLPDVERQLIEQWSTARSGPYPTDEFLHHMFEDRARRTPDAVAVECETTRLSYRELDARAEVLSAHLSAQGVGADDFVGLCLEPSVELVVGILGALKAGAGYVPIDPVTPGDRMAFIVTDSAMQILLTTSDLHPQLPDAAVGGLRVVTVDSISMAADAEPVGREPCDTSGAVLDPAQMVYMMYTSGTTGVPKGVVLPHSAITPWIRWAQNVRPIGPGIRVLHNLSYHFDWSVEQMFHALTSGASLVMPPREVRVSARATAEYVNEQSINMLYLTPTQMRGLAVTGIPMPSLRYLSMGGENLDADLVARVRGVISPGCQIWNEYGPTETAGVAIAGPMGDEPVDRAAMPLGALVANASCGVIDRWGNPTPIGVPGELWIGGDGVARGYHNRPDVTAERFSPDPMRPGRRLYRTGDLVRWRRSGEMEYLGRIDHQVKIRGVRVELEEIESVLRGHADVADAVVVLEADHRLVAYLVSTTDGSRQEAEVRALLASKLPSIMHPAVYVWMDTMPTSPTGKVDRKRLPRPGVAAVPAVVSVPPSTEMEHTVAAVWSQVLGLDIIHVHANFFEVGGDSLMLLSVVDQLRRRLDLDIPIRAVVDTPTIAGLAAQIELLRWALRSRDVAVDTDRPREQGEL